MGVLHNPPIAKQEKEVCLTTKFYDFQMDKSVFFKFK